MVSENKYPKVSVVIPCLNEEKHIEKCLLSILNNDYPPDKLEIIVADGGSTDNTLAVLKEVGRCYPQRLTVINNPKQRQAPGLNLAINQAQGDMIIRMDAHAYCPPNYIKTMMEWLEKSQADNVGPTIDIKPGNSSISARAIAMGVQSPFGIGSVWYRLGVAEPGWVNTVPFGAFHRKLFDRIGYFSEDLYWSEDYEFNLRIRENGGRILLVPFAPVTYWARTSIKQLALQYLRYGFGKSNVMLRNRSLKSWWQLIPPLFLLFLLLGAILRHFSWWVDVLILMVLLAYVSLSILFSLRSTILKKDAAGILLPLVFAVIHFSFGAGFWLRILGARLR